MNKKYKKIFLFLVLISLLSVGLLANAAGLVPCGAKDMPSCRLCHFLFLVRNITDFILKVLVPLAILFVIIGGIIILISRNTSLATTGKRLVRTALMGIIIGIAAWFIVDSIIVSLLQPGTIPFPWYAWQLECPIVKISLPNAITSSYSLVSDTQPTGVSPGDTIKYTLTYTNLSDKNLSNLSIVIDYDQNLIVQNSISSITGNGTDDGDKVSWIIPSLTSQQSVTVSYNFVLTTDFLQFLNQQSSKDIHFDQRFKKLFSLLIRPARGQTSSYYYINKITVSSYEAETESMNDPLALTLPNGLFTTRTYYLIKDIGNNELPVLGNKLRYNIRYFNPTELNFSNVVIISDYDQDAMEIERIDGGGTDDGDKITWNLGNLSAGQPPQTSPACIGYNFTVIDYGTWYMGQFTKNVFYLMANGGILETRNDVYANP